MYIYSFILDYTTVQELARTNTWICSWQIKVKYKLVADNYKTSFLKF